MNEKIRNRMEKALRIKDSIWDYINYVNLYGNECAYTDSIISSVAKLASEIERDIESEIYEATYTEVGEDESDES